MSWEDIIKRGTGMNPDAQLLADAVMSSGEKLTVREVIEKIIQLIEEGDFGFGGRKWNAPSKSMKQVPTEGELHRYLKDNYSSVKEKRNHPLNIDEVNPVRVNTTVYFKEG